MSGRYEKLPSSDEIDEPEIQVKLENSTDDGSEQIEESFVEKIKAAFSEGLKAAAEMSLDVASLSSPFPYPTTIVPSPYPGLKPADQSDQIK